MSEQEMVAVGSHQMMADQSTTDVVGIIDQVSQRIKRKALTDDRGSLQRPLVPPTPSGPCERARDSVSTLEPPSHYVLWHRAAVARGTAGCPPRVRHSQEQIGC